MRSRDAGAASRLVLRSFDEFIAPGYDEQGREAFRAFAGEKQLRERLRQGHFTLVAEVDRVLAGVVQVSEPSHLLMLFVDKHYHRRGIARRLLCEAKAEIVCRYPRVSEITVNASPYAVQMYERFEFAVSGREDRRSGVISMPMKMRINDART